MVACSRFSIGGSERNSKRDKVRERRTVPPTEGREQAKVMET